MITEDYVSPDVAKLLKEKGFDSEECFAFYKEDGEMGFLQTFGDIADYNSETCVLAPTLQMAMKWLREKNDIAIEINVGSGSKDCWVSNVIKGYKTENGTYIQTFVKFSYEEACEAAIQYCLENLI